MKNEVKIRCAHQRMVPIDELKPHPQNRNKHPKDQIKRLAKIIKFQGFRKPITVSKRSGFITAGHGRLLVAQELGLKMVPVDFQEYETEAQEYADLQADNAVALWASLDIESIKNDISDLSLNLDKDLLGIEGMKSVDFGNGAQSDQDEIPEKVKARTNIGDIYRLGTHRLMCGDSTKRLSIEKLMGKEKASLWSSDPPYGINHVAISKGKNQSKKYSDIANDDIQNEELKEFIFKSIKESLPFMKKGFAFYMWHAMKMQAYFSQAAAAAGILFHRQIIWVKPQFVFGRGHYHWQHELCLMGWLEGNEPCFLGERNQSTIWAIGRENDKIHPTQKPVKLFEIPLLNHTKEGEILYEPFAGSGSQIIAAEIHKRRCFAMELDPHYCDVIIARWEKYTGKKAVLLNGTKKA